MPSAYTRANFRVTGAQIQPGALVSHVVAVSMVGSSDAAGLITTSMGGAGAPSMWIGAIILSLPGGAVGVVQLVTPTQSFSGSIGWVRLFIAGVSAGAGNILKVLLTGLIGSV